MGPDRREHHRAGMGHRGHPRHRPDALYADRGYDSQPHCRALRYRRITPHIAKRKTAHGSGLGVYRWVAEPKSMRLTPAQIEDVVAFLSALK